MKFMMIHAVDQDVTPNESRCAAPEGALDAWIQEMEARGLLLDGARLRPVSDATTVRAPGGTPVVTDGPFAETKEQVAGYDVIDCPDLDSAVAVAAAHPTTYLGSIEVRAFAAGMPDPVVADQPADGRLRYLMLVCADMRRAMAAERDATDAHPDSVPVHAAEPAADPAHDPAHDSERDEVDDWVDSVADRRLYGWALETPDAAVTVRRVDGAVVTTDGPFAETKEQIAGYDLLECRDLDEALAAASSHPVAGGGAIELRPLWRW